MEQIKDELGSNAVLLHTKKYREGGVLGGAEMIEVTAAVDESQQRTPQPSPAYVPPASPILPTNVVNRYRMNETSGAEGGAVPQAGPVYDVYAPDVVQLPYAVPPAAPTEPPVPPAPSYPQDGYVPPAPPPAAAPAQTPAYEAPPQPTVATEPPAAPPSAPVADEDRSAERIRMLEDELAQMKTMLASMMAANKPKEVVSIRDALVKQEVREELCEDMAGKIPIADANLDSLDPRAAGVLGGYLSQVMKFTDGLKPGTHGARVYAFIGTTGKGALITADTYRISAVEQLKKYAEILGLPVEVVYSAADLKKAIARHRSKDFVLVDTAGRSQYNEFQMEELTSLLAAYARMEKHLVVSATTKEQDAVQIIERFAPCKPDCIICTKMDETQTFGMVLNLLANRGLPLSFLSNGQSVPDDIIPATAERLAELLLRE